MDAPLPPPPTPQQVAEHARDRMWADDRATRWLGIRIRSVAPGAAVLTMQVTDSMLNGHALCHGGLIAALADSAFAYASNSYDAPTVAAGFAIDLIRPARRGDDLTAACREVERKGRTGLYDCDVTNQLGERIAVFRGRSYTATGNRAVRI